MSEKKMINVEFFHEGPPCEWWKQTPGEERLTKVYALVEEGKMNLVRSHDSLQRQRIEHLCPACGSYTVATRLDDIGTAH